LGSTNIASSGRFFSYNPLAGAGGLAITRVHTDNAGMQG
jgi:hypothetical protein